MNIVEFIRLNVVFKLPKSVAKKAISLSREISKNNEALFVLDGIRFHPHITIYSPEYPAKNLDKILQKVEEIVNKTKKPTLVFKKTDAHKGFIGIEFNCLTEIKKIHEMIVAELNPLREGHIREKYTNNDYKVGLVPEQQENIKKYGYPDSMSLYIPHLTIIRLKDESLAETILKEVRWGIPEFTVNKIAVYKMGKHGTCRELVKETFLG